VLAVTEDCIVAAIEVVWEIAALLEKQRPAAASNSIARCCGLCRLCLAAILASVSTRYRAAYHPKGSAAPLDLNLRPAEISETKRQR
jgi:hypothetical protein